MPKITLTDIVMQNLALPAGNQVDYWDASLSSFGVRVSKGGSKTFVVLVDRQRRTIGHYPRVSLKEARSQARVLLAGAPTGGSTVKKAAVAYSEAVTQYLAVKETELRKGTVDGYARFLRGFGSTKLLRDIKPGDVEDVLAKVEGQTNRSNAHTALKIFFSWCVTRDYCPSNPLQNLKKPRMPAARERVLEDDELSAIWTACGSAGKYGALVRLLILTGQRKGQIAQLSTAWVAATGITFPPQVMKNKREHWCPVGVAGHSVLSGVIPVGDHYFAPVTAPGRPFTAWSKSKKQLDGMIDGVDPWTLHDLRRTWSTNAARLGVPLHVTSRILSHTSNESKISKVYNRHMYRDEMADAMVRMENHVLSLVGGGGI